MSEAWHQQMNNLSWWEQIDRFFNPGKYSCSTNYDFTIERWITVISIAVFIVGLALLILTPYLTKTETEIEEEK